MGADHKESLKKSNLEENELKIELYPKNVPIDKLEKELVSSVLPEDKLCDSLDKNKSLAFPGSNVPIIMRILYSSL